MEAGQEKVKSECESWAKTTCKRLENANVNILAKDLKKRHMFHVGFWKYAFPQG